VTWSPCDPPKTPKTKTGGEQVERVVSDPLVVVPFRAAPLGLEDGHGRWIDYTVEAGDQPRAEAIAAAFEHDRLDSHRPPTLRTFAFVDVEVLDDGRVRFSAVTWREPKAFALEWNGRRLADGLEDAALRQTRGGWWVTSAIVPRGEVRWWAGGLGVTNDARYSVSTLEGDVSAALSLTVSP